MTVLQTSQIALFVVISALGIVAGTATAVSRRPSDRVRSAVQHFAAGVVFSVVAVELLPDLTATHAIPEVIGGFLVGVILLMVIRAKFSGEGGLAEQPSRLAMPQAFPVGLLTGIGIDVFLDGLLLGMGISIGVKEGLLLAAALTLELYSLGLALGADMTNRGLSRVRILRSSAGVSVLLIVGAAAGFILASSGSPHILAAVLSFGCAALLYLVTEELLAEAHEIPETPFATGSFFGGFLLFLIFGMAL